MNVAEYFSKFTPERIGDLVVLPPYGDSKERVNQWVRGSIRYRPQGTADGYLRDLVVTGPKLKICFGGCKWNKIVFGIPNDSDPYDPVAIQFKEWLNAVAKKVKTTIWETPEKYKPGSRSSSRFAFDDDIVKPSSDPDKYADELRCRLSTIRRETTDAERDERNDVLFDPNGETIEIVDADIFTLQDGTKVAVDPTTVTRGSSVIPVVRFSYSRQGDKFGLVLTVTKAQYFANDSFHAKVQNSEWVMDVPSNFETPDPKRVKLDIEEAADNS